MLMSQGLAFAALFQKLLFWETFKANKTKCLPFYKVTVPPDYNLRTNEFLV